MRDPVHEIEARVQEMRAAYRLRPEGDQRVANLWKTLDVARAYEAAGPTTLRTLVRYLEEETEGGAEEGDSPVGDQAGAQVQVVSVHRAKGLEYPIVVLGDILYTGGRGREAIVHHAEGRGWLKIGGFEPEGWSEATAAEKLQTAAEERRLLYVALTRARDHLVIPCLPGELTKAWMSPIIQGFVQPGNGTPWGVKASSLIEGGTRNGTAQVTFVNSPKLSYAAAGAERVSSIAVLEGSEAESQKAQEAERLWKSQRRHAQPATPRDPAEPSPEGSPEAIDDKAAAFGTLVHRLIAIPESGQETLAQAAVTLAAGFGLDQDDAFDAATLAERVRDLPALSAARTADAVHREMPFVCRVNGQVLDGRIDLAYRTAGAWTVIDFKTARTSSASEARTRFTAQLVAYHTAIRSLTGEPVTTSLCLVRTGQLVALEAEPSPAFAYGEGSGLRGERATHDGR